MTTVPLTPQPCVESTLYSALAAGCDIVQPKLLGEWCRVVISRGLGRVYDARGRELRFFDMTNGELCGTLVGQYLHSTNSIVVTDCWEVCEEATEATGIEYTPLVDFGYRQRFSYAKLLVESIGAPLSIIKNYPISQSVVLWQDETLPMNGLVFRWSQAKVGGMPLMVARRYKELPGELV